MKQEKEILAVGSILSIQQLNANPCSLNQNIITRQNLRRCITEIRQQGEVKMLVPVRQMMNLQSLDQAIHAGHAGSIVGTTTMVRQSSGMPAE